MSSTFFGLGIAKSGLDAHRRALDVTSHNIANANTEGYSKQRANIVARSPQSPFYSRPNTEGIIGMGADVAGVERIRDTFLDAVIFTEQGEYNKYDTLRKNIQQIESIYNEPGDNNVRTLLDKFWTDFQALSNDPENMDYRNNVKNSAQSLSAGIANGYKMLRQMKEGLSDNIKGDVTQANELLKEIADLNGKIKSTEALSFHANDLRDKRDLLVGKLSKIMNVQVFENSDEFSVHVGGVAVVQGKSYNELKIQQNSTDLNDFSLYWDYKTTPNNKNVTEEKTIQAATKELSATDSVADLGIANSNSSLAGNGVNVGNTFTINNKTVTLTDAGGGNVTLSSIANDINSTADIGVKASIGLDKNGDQTLFFESSDTGFSNTIIAQDSADKVLQKLGYFTSDGITKGHVEQTAQDEVKTTAYEQADITGGELGAYLDLKNNVVDKHMENLDELAMRLTNEVNKQHKLGYDLDGNQGANFFEPYSTYSRTSDTNNDQVDDIVNIYKIVGNSVTAGNAIGSTGTIYINDKTITYQAGDTYADLVTKINNANAGVYASIETDNFNTGTTRFTLEARRSDNPDKNYRIQYLDDDDNNLFNTLGVLNSGTRFEYRHINKQYSTPTSETPSANPYVVLRPESGIAEKMAVSSSILNDARKIAAAGWTDDGDNIVGGAGDNGNGPGSGENANAIANLKHNSFFEGKTKSFDAYLQNITQDLGVSYENADSTANARDNRLQGLLDLRQQTSGVSLDEEMANLVKFQQGYNASARVITAMDEMLDTLINKVGTVGR